MGSYPGDRSNGVSQMLVSTAPQPILAEADSRRKNIALNIQDHDLFGLIWLIWKSKARSTAPQPILSEEEEHSNVLNIQRNNEGKK